jgi:hypothetical protein
VSVKEKAIEALVEKEQIIIELTQRLQDTENYYKGEIENLFCEIRNLQERLINISEQGIDRSNSFFERDNGLEQKNAELQHKLLQLEIELERKEFERMEAVNLLNADVNEKVQERLMEQITRLHGAENQWIRSTVEQMEKKDEYLLESEKSRRDLEVRLRNLEELRTNELSDFKGKINEMKNSFRTEFEKVKNQYEKQLANMEHQWLERIGSKNEIIRIKDDERDKVMKRIDLLEKENAALRGVNSELAKQCEWQESYAQRMEEKLAKIMEKHEKNLLDLEGKLTSEKKVLALELKKFREEEESQSRRVIRSLT